jgi:hypothetical protein
MSRRLSFDIKERMVTLAGTCFWFWDSFYSFLDSSGVPKERQRRYPREAFNKYAAMRNILGDLEATGNIAAIDALVSNFYRLPSPADRDKLDVKKAKGLLDEFRSAVGNDPIEREIESRERKRARAAYEVAVADKRTQQARIGDLNSRFLALARH